MDEEDTTVYWRVCGKVQGVGFRWFVSRRARALDLRGWVRNMDSGHVHVLATGRAKDIDELRSLIMQGPPGAHVELVENIDSPPEASPSVPFSIIS
jgi:acylphosphatase